VARKPISDDPLEPDEEAIRRRAYEISQRANGGSPEENWARAKEELRDEAWQRAHEPRGRSAPPRGEGG
jgi:hypothetical protein